MLEIPFTKVQSLQEIIFLAEDKPLTRGDLTLSKKGNHSLNFSDMMLSKKQSRAEISRIKHCESLDDIEQPSKLEECGQCRVWKQWAAKQQRLLVEIQTKLVQKQLHLSKHMKNLQKQLQNKNAIVKDFQRVTISLQQNKQQQKMCQKQPRDGQNQPIYQHLNTTSQKINAQFKAMTKFSSSTMLEEHLSKEEINKWQQHNLNLKNEPLNMITTNKFGWSTAAPTVYKKQFQHVPHKFATNIDRYIFENTILKEYNNTLLVRMKNSKFAKLKN